MGSKDKTTRALIKQGTFLAVAGIIVRIIGLIRRIPLQNIIGDTGNGYYAAAYEVYSIILLLSSYSLPAAVSKEIARRVGKGQYKNARRTFNAAFVFALCSGGLAFLLVFFGADFLAGTVMAEPMSIMALRVLSPTLLLVALMGVYRGYFQGFGNMQPTGISQILEQIVLVIVSLTGAYILFGIGSKYGNIMFNENYAASLGATGATIGCGAGALIGLLFLAVVYQIHRRSTRRKLLNDNTKKEESYVILIQGLLITILPFLLSTVMYNLTNVLDQGIFNHFMESVGEGEVKSAIWGVYSGKYKVLINLPIALANAMCSAIIPSLTVSISQHDHISARSKMATVMRFTMMITIPSAIGLAVLGRPIVDMLFSGEIDMAAHMLYIGAFSIIFYGISTLSNGILQGINKLLVPILHSAISLVIHLVALIIMLRLFHWGIYSVVIANLLFAILMCVLNSLSIRKTIGYKQEIKKTFIIPLIASLIMAAFTIATYFLFKLFTPVSAATIVSICVAVVAYLVSMLLLKGITENDIASMPMGKSVVYFLRKLRIF